MKPNKAGKDANQNWKKTAQTDDAEGMQAIPMFYMKQLEAISQQ